MKEFSQPFIVNQSTMKLLYIILTLNLANIMLAHNIDYKYEVEEQEGMQCKSLLHGVQLAQL